MAEVVTTQPGSLIGMADTSLNPQDLPEGLNCLQTLEKLVIIINSKAKKDRYKILDDEEDEVLYAKEVSNCLAEKCCGPARPFIIKITDSKEKGSTTLIKLDRPFRFFLHEIDISSPPDNIIGYVKQIFSPCIPTYEIHDTRENMLFTIRSEHCFPVGIACFKVFDTDNKEVGEIVKKFGCCDMLKSINTFNIIFPSDMDISNKTLLIGATFLINFVNFEHEIIKKIKSITELCV